MSNYYNRETETRHGRDYQISWYYDECADAPWESSDCHGEVTEWTTRDKHPGELILNSDRSSHRFYDFQGAMKKAREVWGCTGTGAEIEEIVRRDYEYLRAWCEDRWFYCGIVVELLNSEGDVIDSASLWGIESDGDHAPIIDDLIGDVDPKIAA